MRHPIRVYVDASVYGGVFDEEFENASRRFFELADENRFLLIASALVHEEISLAPQRVRDFYEQYRERFEVVEIAEQSIALRDAYLSAGIVGARWRNDALHVALASVAGCPLIVSWNFKHIVNFQKIPLYNGVNLSHGWGMLAIHSPMEVVQNEDENI